MTITEYEAAVFAETLTGQRHDDQEHSRPDLEETMHSGDTGRVLVAEKQ